MESPVLSDKECSGFYLRIAQEAAPKCGARLTFSFLQVKGQLWPNHETNRWPFCKNTALYHQSQTWALWRKSSQVRGGEFLLFFLTFQKKKSSQEAVRQLSISIRIQSIPR